MVENILFNLVEETPELINNPFLFSELKTLVKTKSGKIEHQAGSHDDVIMSYLIGLYTLQNHVEANKKQFKRLKNSEGSESFRHSIRPATGVEDGEEKDSNKPTKTISTLQRLSVLVGNNDMAAIYERDKLLKDYRKKHGFD